MVVCALLLHPNGLQSNADDKTAERLKARKAELTCIQLKWSLQRLEGKTWHVGSLADIGADGCHSFHLSNVICTVLNSFAFQEGDQTLDWIEGLMNCLRYAQHRKLHAIRYMSCTAFHIIAGFENSAAITI